MDEDYVRLTIASLNRCARWLEHNAERLARDFDSARDWSIEFSSSDAFPNVSVSLTRSVTDRVVDSRDSTEHIEQGAKS